MYGLMMLAILSLLACRMADVRTDDVGNLKTSGLYDGGCTD